jgi:putative membrane protein
MSRTSRILITTLFLAGTAAACKSQREEAKEETPAGATVPAQTTPPGTMPRADQPAEPDQPTGEMAGGTTAPPTTAPAAPAAPMAAEPSDMQIASVVSAANKMEIDGGKLAQSKTKNADVKAFAEMMVKDHGKAEDDAAMLLKKLSMTAEEHELATQWKTESTSTLDRLNRLSGAEFDQGYMAEQVQAHQKLLDQLDKTLISGADNPELKSHLNGYRTVIATHLAEAKRIEAKLKEMPAAPAQ